MIKSLSPSSIAAGSPAFLLSVNGSQFLSGAVVFFNGVQLPTTFVNSGLVTVTVPANLVTTSGLVPVVVENPGGTNSNVDNFFVAPTITSLSPPSTAIGSSAFTLTVNGTQFQPTSVVFLNTFGLATTFVNSGQLTAIVPANLVAAAGSFPVVVSVVGGLSAPFNFIVNPVITSLAPPSVAAGSAQFTLSVAGAGFLPGAAVSFNGVTLGTTFVNSGQLTASVAANMVATAGTYPVVVTNNGGGTSAPFNFIVTSAITSLSPPSVAAGSPAFTLTVNGVQFLQTSVVGFNGTALSTSFVNGGQLTATVPANLVAAAGAFPVTVSTPGAGVSAPVNFFVVPAISGLSPASVAALSPAFTLSVTGATFAANSVVSFNGTPLTTTFSNSGLLTATVPANLLTAAGAFPVVVTTPNVGASAPVNFIVNPTITGLSPASVPAGSAAFTLSVTGATFFGGQAPTNFPSARSANIRSLPSANSLSSVVSFNGVNLPTTVVNANLLTATVPANLVTTAGAFPVVVINPGNSVSAPATFTVTPSLSIVTTSLPSGAAGSLYTATLLGTGGVQPYTWLVSGLPPGVGSTPSTGVILGVPLQGGTFSIAVTLKDAVGASVSGQFSLVIARPPVTITTGGLPNGTVGVPYVGVVGATGGTSPYNFTLGGGALPDGLSLKSDGSVVGTPQTPGTFSFSVNVTDASGASTGRGFTITIAPAPLVVTGGPPASGGTSGVPLTVTFSGSGGVPPYKCAAAGTLPPGTTFANCTLTGTPTTPGTYTFTVTVTDSTGVIANKSVTITVAPPGLSLTGTVGNGQVGVAYGGQLTGIGGVPPYSYGASGLPDGLSLSSTSGAITGTPTTAGQFSISATVSDSTGAKASATFTLTIAPAALTITTASLPDGTVNSLYSATLKATGGVIPYSWSVSGLPAGLTATSDGAINGTPTAPGKFTVSATVTDKAGTSVSQQYNVTMAPPGITITTTQLPVATVGTAYSAPLSATGGVTPLTWSATGLPAALTISAGGTISGTPGAPGSFTVIATVKDSLGTTAQQTFPLSIVLPPAPPLSFSGISSTSPPAQQPQLQVSFATTYPVDVVVTLTLTFAPDSGADDPSIQFSTGGRTTKITIPAGSTVGASSVGLQTGTVAGLITITSQLQASGQDVTPTPAPRTTIRIAALAPVPTTVTATRTSTGFTVTVVGYVTDREVTQANFTFNAAPGSNLLTTSLTVPVDQLFSAYFSGASAIPFGGQFNFTQAFTVTGNSQAIVSVTIAMVNKIGQSTAVTVNLN